MAAVRLHAPFLTPLLLLAAMQATAFPDGAPWEVASADGCVQCHFDMPPSENSQAIEIAGLPASFEPGARYMLTVRLRDEDMAVAGFLLSAWQGGEAAGGFEALDARSEAQGAQARSTAAGAPLSGPAVAEWQLEWTAPDDAEMPVLLELWANAGNADRSPFGDSTHRRSWELGSADQ